MLWNSYCLKLPPSFSQTHPVFLVTLLKPYNADTISKHIQHDPPPPTICNRVEKYKVEWSLDSQVFWGRLEYLVCWMGYGIEEDKWRLAGDVKGSKWLVSNFHHRNPEAPQHISTLNFSNLQFHPISKFTNTPDTVPQDGPQVIMHWDIMPLRGGKCQGFPNPTLIKPQLTKALPSFQADPIVKA